MAGVKYSKQREMIMEYLKSTTAHPTAETVYMKRKSKTQFGNCLSKSQTFVGGGRDSEAFLWRRH